jgi:acyl carrier protein
VSLNHLNDQAQETVTNAIAITWRVSKSDVQPESTFIDLEVDSMAWLELEVALEDDLGVTLGGLGAHQFRIVAELIEYVTFLLDTSRERGTSVAAASSVRSGTVDDLEDLTMILSDGFSEDPLLTWIYNTPEQYAEWAPIFFRWMVRRTLELGSAYIAPGKGALLGQPSSTVDTTDQDETRTQRELIDVGGPAAPRLRTFMNAARDNHPMITPHWYGTFQAVRRGFRPDGIGVDLFKAATDEHQVPMYCETTTDRNKAFWTTRGFHYIGMVDLAPGVFLNQMWRDGPLSAGSAGR